MMRVIGSYNFLSPKNNRVKAFQDWMEQFEGCIFTSEDWKHFKDKVKERVAYYNTGVKEGGYRIAVSIDDRQITVTCGNGKCGEWFSQLFITVIPVKLEYNRTIGEAVEYDSPADGEEEGGDHERG